MMRGHGMVDWFNKMKSGTKEAITRVKNAVRGARDGYPPSARQELERFADWVVTSLTVRRDPVQSAINSALNVVSLGQWNKSRADQGIDKLYHLGLVIGLTSSSGEHHDLLAEKNAVINFGLPKATTGSTQIMRIAAPIPPETLGVFMEKAEQSMGKTSFFQYDSFRNNCQDFIRGILRANNALTSSAETFLKQDLSKVVDAQPKHLGAVANAVTNLGARIDRLIQGGDMDGGSLTGGSLVELRAAWGRAREHALRCGAYCQELRDPDHDPPCSRDELRVAENKYMDASRALHDAYLRVQAAEAAEAVARGRGLTGGGLAELERRLAEAEADLTRAKALPHAGTRDTPHNIEFQRAWDLARQLAVRVKEWEPKRAFGVNKRSREQYIDELAQFAQSLASRRSRLRLNMRQFDAMTRQLEDTEAEHLRLYELNSRTDPRFSVPLAVLQDRLRFCGSNLREMLARRASRTNEFDRVSLRPASERTVAEQRRVDPEAHGNFLRNSHEFEATIRLDMKNIAETIERLVEDAAYSTPYGKEN